MSDIEYLELGILEFEKHLEDDPNNEWLKRCIKGMKSCKQRLEAIDNANPSEALEELEKDIKGRVILAEDRQLKLCAVIKATLLKAQEQEKVLEIIKEKPQAELSLIQLGKIKTYEEYLKYTDTWDSYYWEYEYTEEEFDLLKRYFNERYKNR